jgi:hypothetical protein
MTDEVESMYAIPEMQGKPVRFWLSPTPEYRSVMVDAETGDGVGVKWDNSVEDVHVPSEMELYLRSRQR